MRNLYGLVQLVVLLIVSSLDFVYLITGAVIGVHPSFREVLIYLFKFTHQISFFILFKLYHDFESNLTVLKSGSDLNPQFTDHATPSIV